MTFNPTRRQVLVGGASLATIVALGGVHPAFAGADRTKITVRVEKDLSNLIRPIDPVRSTSTSSGRCSRG
jgi:peptide/nickel transport system substrate-binding protein